MEMTKEMSLAFIQMEREGAKDARPKMQEMLETIEKGIQEDRISYTDFVDDLVKYFSEMIPKEEIGIDERTVIVDNICQKIIDKHGSKEE